MVKYSVYILYSKGHDRFYIGTTANVIHRLSEHNTGSNDETKTGIPWKLIHFEDYDSLSQARQREFLIKAWKSRQFMIDNLNLKF